MEQSITSSFDRSQVSSPGASLFSAPVSVGRSEFLASRSIVAGPREMARSEQFVTAAALPALLPTPPRSKMVPLLPTPCLVILPISFASPCQPKPGRADSVERWDARKSGAAAAGGPAPATDKSSHRSRSLCRADACERWDSNKTTSPSRSSTSSLSSSPSRSRSGSSISSRSPARSSSSRASSAKRWDIHKKPRLQAGALDGEKGSNAATTMSPTTDKEIRKPRYNGTKMVTREARAEFAGPSFPSPEPSVLPLPKFLMAH
ncbi:hypothetical protein E2562_038988 [Oryza meyeriana var. granulata]|uniref:Uncharacterized protein n=1 Tax=Oryza meyeriana var. granulata TaxID=110450 RepID=A0A6G1EUF8_9ORYZ|nr:hypothetical protein E2562_038988 [Oryza meyeriana var. granulata]